MSPAIDITAEQRETILTLLEQNLPDTTAWVYGSRAKWTSQPQSDLDLVIFSKPEQKCKVRNLREALEESDLPFRVDLFVWDEVPESFREQIEAEHVALISKVEKKKVAGWAEVKIGEIVDVIGGSTPSTKNPDNFDGDIPWLTPKDLSGLHDRYVSRGARNLSQQGLDSCSARLVPAKSVLLSTRAPIGYVALAKNPIATNQGFRNLIPRDGTDSEFLYYWLLQNTKVLEQYASGSTFRELSGTSLKEICLPSPPLQEQRTIAHILGALDDKIELNRRVNKTLEAMAQAIFKDWFVDFGPTRAKMEGREPYLPYEVWDLFPDALDDGGKPVGWEVSLLGDRVEILDSKRIPLSSQERRQCQGPYAYYGATGVMDHVNDFLFEGIHVLLGEDGSVIKPNGKPFVQYVWDQFWVNNHAHVLRGKDISNEMLLCFLQQTNVTPYVTGAVQLKLNQKNLKAIPFSASDSGVATAFEKVVKPLFKQFRLTFEESFTLSTTRDALLPKLMSGEIRFPEVDKMVEALA